MPHRLTESRSGRAFPGHRATLGIGGWPPGDDGGEQGRGPFLVEDEDDKPVRAILRQWPALSRRVAVCPCFGIDNLPKGRLQEGLLNRAGLELRAVVHRDRDFMTDEEVARWGGAYAMPGAFPWVCADGDVESYFCRADYLAALYGVDLATAEGWRSAAAASIPPAKAREKFFEKRKAVNWIVYRDAGGSPASEALWTTGGGASPRNQLGKALLGALKTVVKSAGQDDKALGGFRLPPGYEMASDLRATLERALGAVPPVKPAATPTPVVPATALTETSFH